MSFIDNILQMPSYGWSGPDGELLVPTRRQLFRELLVRINIFKSRKNWISLSSLLMTLCLIPFLYAFLFHYFYWPYVLLLLFYSMFVMSIHATVWLHRYCTHRAFSFSHPFWRFIFQHIVIKTVPEEIYVLSHHVHHAKSDLPGDPYNARGGFWYCMLAEINHQSVSKNLSGEEYRKLVRWMKHTGVPLHSYRQYTKWGSLSSPWYNILSWGLNWTFWFIVFDWLGGPGLAAAIFSAAICWFIMVRAFNYTGHGKGQSRHRDGLDFDRTNLSVNQLRPGILAGEWHNNHHLYPVSARTGFLPYQVDIPWLLIKFLNHIGIVSSYTDSKLAFLHKYANSNSKLQEKGMGIET